MTARLPAIWVLYRRSVRELIALGPQTMVIPLAVPTFMLLAQSAIFADVFQRLDVRIEGVPGFGPDPHYLQYLIAGPMVMAALLATASAGVGVAVERQVGFYDRMQLAPLGASISGLGRRLADGTRIAIAIVVLSLVAWLAGADVDNWALALGVTIPLAALLGMAYGGLAFSLCLRSGSAEAAQAVTPLFIPVLFLSTAFVPVDVMPDWLQPIADYNPLSAVCDAIRLAFAGTFSGGDVWRSLAAIAVLGVVTQTLVVRAARRVEDR